MERLKLTDQSVDQNCAIGCRVCLYKRPVAFIWNTETFNILSRSHFERGDNVVFLAVKLLWFSSLCQSVCYCHVTQLALASVVDGLSMFRRPYRSHCRHCHVTTPYKIVVILLLLNYYHYYYHIVIVVVVDWLHVCACVCIYACVWQSSSSSASHADDAVVRYASQYDQKLDPFTSFSKRERLRKYMALRPYDKITLSMVCHAVCRSV